MVNTRSGLGIHLKFSPDAVVNIVRHNIEQYHLPPDYVVNVVECQSRQVIYGFAILKTEQTNMVPCKGRTQPEACYAINIAFRNTMLGGLNKNYVWGAGGGLTALMLVFSGLRVSVKQRKPVANGEQLNEEKPTGVLIGRYNFYANGRYLEYGEKRIDLSDKETRLLTILANKQNEVVERNILQKVWEDEGVIVGRSLDMFISKLRKKLEGDPTVRLVNVHGKGYKLETC